MPVDPSQGTSLAVGQVGQPVNHGTPLTVSISPEGNTKTSANHRDNSSSSLLLARRDESHFPSRSSIPSISRRKKTARKSVFPRKVSPTSSPNLSLNGKAIHGMHFQREVGLSARHTETVDSPGLCDSTENGSLRPSMEEAGEEMEVLTQHRENHGSDAVAAFSVEDSASYANFPTLESSSTNGSSPAISEGHPALIDIHSDSRETSGGENDSDTNFVSSENSPAQHHSVIAQNSHRNNKQGSIVDNEETQCSRTQTPIVVLQNTVQVKTEPNEVAPLSNNQSPEQNSKEVNQSHSGVNSEREGRDVISAVEGFPLSQHHVVPTSSQEGHANSQQIHPGSSLMPRVVNVVGASMDHDDQMETSHHLHSGAHYMDLKEYSCDICHKQFDSANSVLRHKRSHTGDRPYICKICGWGFNLSGNLNQHLAIHQKVKPFKCVYCGKTFARSNVLKAHVRCHTGERPFQCQLCGSKFIIGHNLKKHMVTRHGIKEDDRMFSQNDAPDDSGRSHDDNIFPQNNSSHENSRYQHNDKDENLSMSQS